MSIFTERQAEEVAAFKHDELARINIYDGSVRSGKTWITAVIWTLWLSTQEHDGNFLMCGKTLTSLKRNVLDLLVGLFGAKHISYSIPSKTARIFGKTVLLEGASDARSEAKIRGLTLLGAYCDELTLFPEDFFAMLLSRLSEKGAKLFTTTNPDSPMHWLWKGYLSPEAVEKKGLNLRHARFLIDDNTTLEREYLDNIKREYTGVFYDRYILGEWAVAEGLIYTVFDAARHVVDVARYGYDDYAISIDYGTLNACAMLLWGRRGKAWYCVDEYYYCGRDERVQKTDDEYYSDLETLADVFPVHKVIVDPSAASFITLIRKKARFAVRAADNSVLDGIREVATALNTSLLFINRPCVNTIREFGLYRWDEKASDDKPLKENDHALDAVRYLVKTLHITRPSWRGV